MGRLAQMDLLRGLIMAFMALDHASAMIARQHFGEMWGVDFTMYPDWAWWFTRSISHLCAPGFFFLMGMGIALFAAKRQEAGWAGKDIRNYFLKRGGLILLFMFFLEMPAWGLGFAFSQVEAGSDPMPGHYEGGFLLPSTVLYGLGICMIISSLLWKLKDWQLLLITVSAFALSGGYIYHADPAQAYNPLMHFLLVPGMSKGAMVIYPVIPWLGICTFGMFWASLFRRKPDAFNRLSLLTGLAFIALFLGLRYLEFGNFQKDDYSDWMGFLTLIKYPPSLAFALATCGINLVLLAAFSLVKEKKWLKPLLIFGQTAMFFYIVHLYLYAIISMFFPMGTDIGIMYAFWLLGLVALYFICARFLHFKKKQPMDSFWRMV